MVAVTPFLLFDGNCAEAMTFYQRCFGGELTLIKLGDTPMKDQMPPDKHDRITYSQLKSCAIQFSAVDWLHPTRVPKQGNTVALYVTDGTYDELNAIFERLSEDADESLLDELRAMPFGTYGHLADKYGVHWFFRGDAQS
jgi:PhnB protein